MFFTLMAKEMYITKSILINKNTTEIYNFLKYSKNQDTFSIWSMADTQKTITEFGIDGTVGHIYSWSSKNNKVGAGSQEIVNLVDEALISYKIKFERPMKNTAQTRFIIKKETPQQTTVTWEFQGLTKFPMCLFQGFFQKMLGKDIEQSLINLKNILEQ